MWILSRTLDELREEDLQGLIGVRENVGLDFKREMYPARDPEKKHDMLVDITSMANAEGGVLIIGMAEDGDTRATQLQPIPKAEDGAVRIVNTCLTNVADRIPGLRTKRVPLAAGGEVLVVYIPRSYRRPHMITMNEVGEFWIRHDRRNASMSIAEIRSAITTTENATMKVESFVQARHEALGRVTTTVELTLTGTPLLLEDERLDVTEPALVALVGQPPAFRPQVGTMLGGRTYPNSEPSLHGLKNTNNSTKRLELYRNGHVEFFVLGEELFYRRSAEDPTLLRGSAVAEHVRNFVHFASAVRQFGEIADPYVFGLTLWRSGGIGMYRSYEEPGHEVHEYREAPQVALDPILGSLDEPDRVVRRLLDRFWNAFGYESCPFFTPSGVFFIPERR
jgi:hypothetical protein